MKYIITIITTIFLFSCSGSKGNADSSCTPDWYGNYKKVGFIGKLFGKKDYQNTDSKIYARATARAYDRNSVQDAAVNRARAKILSSTSSTIIGNLIDETLQNNEKLSNDRKLKKTFKSTLENKIKTNINATCRACNTIKFIECYNDKLGEWDGFALVEFDLKTFRSDEFQDMVKSTALSLGMKEDEVQAFNAP